MTSSQAPSSLFDALRPEHPDDTASIRALHEEAFGPGRFAKGAYRIRESADGEPSLSYVAVEGNTIIASVRFSHITVGDEEALFLGPLTVHPGSKNKGYGLALMQKTLALAEETLPQRICLLVGDLAYYGRARFMRTRPGLVHFPAPVDPLRLLWRPMKPGAAETSPSGLIRGRRLPKTP